MVYTDQAQNTYTPLWWVLEKCVHRPGAIFMTCGREAGLMTIERPPSCSWRMEQTTKPSVLRDQGTQADRCVTHERWRQSSRPWCCHTCRHHRVRIITCFWCHVSLCRRQDQSLSLEHVIYARGGDKSVTIAHYWGPTTCVKEEVGLVLTSSSSPWVSSSFICGFVLIWFGFFFWFCFCLCFFVLVFFCLFFRNSHVIKFLQSVWDLTIISIWIVYISVSFLNIFLI